MKISCPSCAAKYSITDEKVRDRLAKIRCRKCGTTIVIDGKVDPPHVTAAAPVAVISEPTADAGYNDGGAEGGPEPGGYSVDMGDDDQRSMSVPQIVDAYQRGEISDTTYVWADGMIDWQRVADVAELSHAIGLTPGDAAPESEPLSRAATRSGTGRGSAADLFGGIESAGSEDDVTTSAPEPVAATAATGARNESSVLFSLSALTGSATPTAPLVMPKTPSAFPSKPSVSNEDSGLIDLKALTATINAPGIGSDAMMGSSISPLNLGAPPIGMGGPLGGVMNAVPATDNADVGRGGSGGKSAMFIGGAILVVGLALAGVLFATHSGSDEPKPEPAAAAAAPVATAVPQPTQAAPHATTAPVVKTAEAIAAPPPTGTAVASAPPPVKPTTPSTATAARAITGTGSVAKHKTTSSASGSSSSSSGKTSSSATSGSSSSSSSSGSSAASEAPAEPKKKKCDCKPSDLMCAMKCSAK